MWKSLVNAKAVADHELQTTQTGWKTTAKDTAESALAALPGDLAAAGLPASELQETLSTPLQTFLGSIDGEGDPRRIAVLPDRASRLVDELAAAMAREVEQRAPKPLPPEPGSPPAKAKEPKPVKRVRVADVVKAVRIESETQWDLVRNSLDEKVRKELAAGNSVELS
jgi:hypothetical protein